MVRLSETSTRNQLQEDLTYSVFKGIEFYQYILGGYDKFIGEIKEMQKQIQLYLEKLKLDIARILQTEFSVKRRA